MAFDERVFDRCRRHWLGVLADLRQLVFCHYRRHIQSIYEFFQLLVFG